MNDAEKAYTWREEGIHCKELKEINAIWN